MTDKKNVAPQKSLGRMTGSVRNRNFPITHQPISSRVSFPPNDKGAKNSAQQMNSYH